MPVMNTDMIFQIYTSDSADTERIGETLGELLKGGEVINLRADLGGGKTTFVKGLARGAGSKDRVASPTFTLSKIYFGNNLEIHHYDFYRLTDAGVLFDQVEESISSPHVVTVIEWSEVVKAAMPTGAVNILFEPVSNNPDERTITISYSKESFDLIEQLKTGLVTVKP